MAPERTANPTASPGWAVLLLLAYLGGCAATDMGRTRESVAQPRPAPPAGEVLSIRQVPGVGADLWSQSLDGEHQRPLTTGGRVALLGLNVPGWGGVALSPDGKQVAYAEYQRLEASDPERSRRVRRWNVLFVVNVDGTARRKLLDLTHLLAPEGKDLGAGSFVWSDDGRSIAYVLESSPKEPHLQDCWPWALHSVDVASGRDTSLSGILPSRFVTLLGWSQDRGEAVLHTACGWPEAGELVFPVPDGRVTVLRVRDGTVHQQPAVGPSLSPDGRLVFIPHHARAFAGPPALYRTESLGGPPALVLELPHAHTGRIHWLHRAPAALLSSTRWEGPSASDCPRPRPRVLFRLELGTGTLHRVREDASALNVVAISPDDTHALVGIVTGESREMLLCRPGHAERLFVVRLEDLASELPLEELLRRGTPLTPPRLWSSVYAFADYVGWGR